jgi:hypothetical protein
MSCLTPANRIGKSIGAENTFSSDLADFDVLAWPVPTATTFAPIPAAFVNCGSR